MASLYFNPRLREGGDVKAGELGGYVEFQSTPPRRRRLGKTNTGKTYTDFNPRLREGGDVADALALGRDNISIHASAKEAT